MLWKPRYLNVLLSENANGRNNRVKGPKSSRQLRSSARHYISFRPVRRPFAAVRLTIFFVSAVFFRSARKYFRLFAVCIDVFLGHNDTPHLQEREKQKSKSSNLGAWAATRRRSLKNWTDHATQFASSRSRTSGGCLLAVRVSSAAIESVVHPDNVGPQFITLYIETASQKKKNKKFGRKSENRKTP